MTAGYLLGDQWCSILGVLNIFEDIVIVIFIVVIVLLIARWARNLMRNRRNGGEQAE